MFFSLQYLNYPTQVIFKSCKLIPVLIGGILIQRKRKGLLDFVAAASGPFEYLAAAFATRTTTAASPTVPACPASFTATHLGNILGHRDPWALPNHRIRHPSLGQFQEPPGASSRSKPSLFL